MRMMLLREVLIILADPCCRYDSMSEQTLSECNQDTMMIYGIDNCCTDDVVVMDYPKADNLYDTSLFDLYDAALFAMLITKLCKAESTL